MWQKKLKDMYRSVRFELKYFFKEFPFKRKFQRFYAEKKNTFYQKKYNLIRAYEFMQKFNCGELSKNVLDCGIDLYNFDDVYLSCFGDCIFVQKFGGKKVYTLEEGAGIIKRLYSTDIRFTKPLNLSKNVIDEDEVCMVCFVHGHNYWHFTCEIIPKIMIMERNGYKGKYIVNVDGCAKEFLELLSIPDERLIFRKEGEVIHAKKVHLFNESFGIELDGKWLSDTRDFIIQRIEEKHGSLIDDKLPKKLYVSRIGTRRIINEEQIIEYLKPLGFEVVVPERFSILEQIKFFANADIIVNPHGANCTNILYSKKGTTFVECFGHEWVNPCMIGTIDMLDLDYHMICERFADNFPNANKFSNYVINMTIFKCVIKKIFESRSLEETCEQVKI